MRIAGLATTCGARLWAYDVATRDSESAMPRTRCCARIAALI